MHFRIIISEIENAFNAILSKYIIISYFYINFVVCLFIVLYLDINDKI